MRYFLTCFWLAIASLSIAQSTTAFITTAGTHARYERFYDHLSEELFEDSLHRLYDAVGLRAYKLSFAPFRQAMIGYYNLQEQGKLSGKNLVTIIDFTKPSTEKRFFTVDLDRLTVMFHTYVSHGKNSGGNMAESFSNKVHSNQSSIGFFVTGETYTGSKGYSLRLDGMDKGYNDNVRVRAVVMHAADYVSEDWIQRYGRLGRSQGCPALPTELSQDVIDALKEKTLLFIYFNDRNYEHTSQHLDLKRLLDKESVTAHMMQ